MNLIVNADDFGLTQGINLGVVEGIINGIVTSCTMVANGQTEVFTHGAELARKHHLDVGVHLVLTMGKPVLTSVSSLTDEAGRFYSLSSFDEHIGNIDKAELKAEFLAQIDKIRQAGITVTHLDSHHHVHMNPYVREIYLEIAREQNLPVRGFIDQKIDEKSVNGTCPEQIITDFYGDEVSEVGLIQLLRSLSGESAEIMCHPSYVDQQLMEVSRYNTAREQELKILTSADVKEEVKKLGINLIGYREFMPV